ncbi:MAG TPA: HD domain-containing phosphohydrolase [Gemmatimonadaceae bacterium]
MTAPAAHLLVVDDERPLRESVARYLRRRGFVVDEAADGAEALAALDGRQFAAVICDILMPGVDGFEVARRAAAADADLAIVMLTAVNDAASAKRALHSGASEYLLKPMELDELGRAIDRALHKRDLLIDRRRTERLIRDEVEQRAIEIEREKALLRELSVGIVDSLVTAMEAKEPFYRGQSARVAELAAAIAREMVLPGDVVEQVRLAGRLRDVGRIGVREAVLNKVGTLTDAEIEHIREHLLISVEMLAPLTHLGPVITFVRDHHERWDGAGYPRGLRGPEISIGGRILAAADAFNALTSERPYRERLTPERAATFMTALSGTLIDPDVFKALERVMRK